MICPKCGNKTIDALHCRCGWRMKPRCPYCDTEIELKTLLDAAKESMK